MSQIINDSAVLQPNINKSLVSDDIFHFPMGNKIKNNSKIFIQIQNILWRFFISPMFLFTSFIIYTFVPVRIFKRSLNKILIYKFNVITKRFLDIFGSLVVLLPGSILFLIISILIKLDSSGTILYTQVRVGHDRRKKPRRKINADVCDERRGNDRRKGNFFGKPFVIYKFRTMRMDAESKCGPVWATENDPRVTTIGHILRYSHLDELPQIINILKGEMSFVGPRPERPYFVNQLANKIPGYVDRLKVKPGLTGLAQVHWHYDRSIEDVKKKLKYDLRYCQNGNLKSYFNIIFTTIIKKLFSKITLDQ